MSPPPDEGMLGEWLFRIIHAWHAQKEEDGRKNSHRQALDDRQELGDGGGQTLSRQQLGDGLRWEPPLRPGGNPGANGLFL